MKLEQTDAEVAEGLSHWNKSKPCKVRNRWIMYIILGRKVQYSRPSSYIASMPLIQKKSVMQRVDVIIEGISSEQMSLKFDAEKHHA